MAPFWFGAMTLPAPVMDVIPAQETLRKLMGVAWAYSICHGVVVQQIVEEGKPQDEVNMQQVRGRETGGVSEQVVEIEDGEYEEEEQDKADQQHLGHSAHDGAEVLHYVQHVPYHLGRSLVGSGRTQECRDQEHYYF